MRTTTTLDPDVATKLKTLAYRRRASFKATLNEVIRRGLAAQDRAGARAPRFSVEAHPGRFLPGIDLGKLNQLVDQLEVEEFARLRPRRRRPEPA